MANEKDELPKGSQTEGTEGETISELAHRHLHDINHSTTDEEMRNAKIELTENVEVDEENLADVHNTTVFPPLPGEETEPENDTRDDRDETPPPNPYGILGS